MEKKYGLILPGEQKKKPIVIPKTSDITRPSIFDESSDDSVDDGPPLKMKSGQLAMAPSLMERRRTHRMQEKALEEDPTVFQYDELYDEMETKREEAQQIKSKEPKKPKYIGRLMEFAERRKLENELRVERQVQKEREAEGEEFKDKESFVTSTYRKKLEEMRKLEEREKHDEYLEAIGDVTKQKGLDGFYRHLYEQKLGTSKEVQKPLMPTTAAGNEEIAYKPIKSGKAQQQRAYRKRRSSLEEEELQEEVQQEAKKMHLQNNIDADSDFSIDSSSSSDEADTKDNKVLKQKNKGVKIKESDKTSSSQIDTKKIALKLDSMKKGDENHDDNDDGDESNKNIKENEKQLKDEVEKETATVEPPKPKKDKTEIWKKRTVGAVLEAAVQRYYERKAARSNG